MDLQALLITFRETLEALLIIGIIVTYLKKMNHPEYTKYVWLGAGLALVASLGVAFVFQVVLTSFAMMASQIYLKISIMLISSMLLTHMVFWMSKNSRDMKGKLEGKLKTYVTAGSVIGMVVHSFLVILREGIETVFFFAAITGGNIQEAIQSWGALAGILIAAGVSYFFFKGTMRIPLKTFFRITGAMIIIIAAGLLVQGIGMMQDVGIIGSVMPQVYDLTWFLPEHPTDYTQYLRDTGSEPLISGDVGIFFTALLGYAATPSIEEILVYFGYFAGILLLLKSRRNENTETKSSEKRPSEKKNLRKAEDAKVVHSKKVVNI
ncbi:FTR1 family iron permease [Chengkuizengella axinellae]|uniref:FTR1 family protein n=1 Tax=Chengkuizengella axinellae TaxID=3064388 RepID=A0ABT9J1P5_9BACL|nr:FTR1 family protein [Chengkuizengella sp. 2205SS18-9]MDP5275342.1 FTR1 family protein [Chengkuizengella sp. 2205SS18-9]